MAAMFKAIEVAVGDGEVYEWSYVTGSESSNVYTRCSASQLDRPCKASEGGCELDECQEHCENDASCNYIWFNVLGMCQTFETCDSFGSVRNAGVSMAKTTDDCWTGSGG